MEVDEEEKIKFDGDNNQGTKDCDINKSQTDIPSLKIDPEKTEEQTEDEKIKAELIKLGIKAGGRPQDRLERYKMVQEVNGDLTKLSKKMFAKKNK